MSAASNQIPECVHCHRTFDWNDAYQAQDTPGSAAHNPPGHGVFRPRAYCPNCGALVAEWHIDRYKDYNEWIWYGENAAQNSGKNLPPNPLLAWGNRIPVALRPTIDEDHLGVDKIREQKGIQVQKEPDTSAEAIALARQAEQLLNDGELEQASKLFDQAAAAGMKRRDRAYCLGATGVSYLYKRGDVENAYRYCRRGVELDPGANWQANYVLSLIYSAAGETEKANKELADAQRFAGSAWWVEDFERGLKTNLNTWTEEHGKAALRVIVLANITAGGIAITPVAGISSMGVQRTVAAGIPVGVKKCPLCGEEIKLEARVCRFCRARFDVSVSGYCSTCHKIVQPDSNGKCLACQGELLDRRITSQLIEDAAPIPAPSAAQAAGQTSANQEQALPVDAAAAASEIPPAKPMNFWRLFFSPNGRINRSMFLVNGFLLIGFIVLIFMALGWAGGWETSESGPPFSDTLIPVFASCLFVASWSALMLLVKRLHDINRSGWNLLFILIPLVGQLMFLIIWLMCIFMKSVDNGNRYDGRPIADAASPLPHPSTTSSNDRWIRTRRWIVACAGIVALAAGGFLLATNYLNGSAPTSQPTSLPAAAQSYSETSAPISAVTSAPTAVPDKISTILFDDHQVSFDYPSNWEVIDDSGVQTLLKGTLKGIGDWEYIGGVYTNSPDDCRDCAQIVVTVIPLPDGFPGWSDEFYESIKQNAQSAMGDRLQLHRQVRIGDHPGWESIYLGKSGRTKLWDKSFVPKDGNVLVMLSASANPDQFDQFQPIFEQAYSTLTLYGAQDPISD